MKLIDGDELRDEVLHDNTFDNETVNYYLGLIDCADTIDAVPVVRCKECKHYTLGPFGMGCMVHFNRETDIFTHNQDDYCSYGEKMEVKHG